MVNIGNLNLRINADIRGLQRDFRRVSVVTQRAGRTASRSFNRTLVVGFSGLRSQVNRAITAAFSGVRGIINNVLQGVGQSIGQNIFNSITNAVSEFTSGIFSAGIAVEQLGVAFETIIGDATRAKNLLEEIGVFARATPFELPEVQSASRQLLAFGVESERIIPTLRRLGDIASGLGIRLEELAFLYGQTRTQQTLYTQDINQFASRGVPIYEKLAEVLGTVPTEVKKIAAEGKIGFRELQLVIADLTNEGGQFFNLMEKQSKTIGGQISNLSDQFTRLNVSVFEAFQPLTGEVISILAEITKQAVNQEGVFGQIRIRSQEIAAELATNTDLADNLGNLFATVVSESLTLIVDLAQNLTDTLSKNPEIIKQSIDGMIAFIQNLNAAVTLAGELSSYLINAVKSLNDFVKNRSQSFKDSGVGGGSQIMIGKDGKLIRPIEIKEGQITWQMGEAEEAFNRRSQLRSRSGSSPIAQAEKQTKASDNFIEALLSPRRRTITSTASPRTRTRTTPAIRVGSSSGVAQLARDAERLDGELARVLDRTKRFRVRIDDINSRFSRNTPQQRYARQIANISQTYNRFGEELDKNIGRIKELQGELQAQGRGSAELNDRLKELTTTRNQLNTAEEKAIANARIENQLQKESRRISFDQSLSADRLSLAQQQAGILEGRGNIFESDALNRRAAISAARESYELTRRDLNNQLNSGGLEIEEFNKKIAMLEDQTATSIAGIKDQFNSARRFIEPLGEVISGTLKDVFTGAVSLGEGIQKFFKGVVDSLLDVVINILTNQIITGVLGLFGGGGGLLGGLLGGGGGGGLLGGLLGGGGFPGFAEGGIVTGPTLATVGERGSEAIVPLKNGSIPVSFNGGSTAPPVVSNVSVVVNNDGSSEISNGQANILTNRVKTVVVQELENQKRPGGILYGSGA